MALLTEGGCLVVTAYKHGTPKGVQVVLAVTGYKHGTPNGVRLL